MAFTGFFPQTAEFLMGIRLNNEKAWFEAHKHDYEAYVKQPMLLFAQAVHEHMAAAHSGFDARPKVSRIYRDTRFSREKLPYKHCTWFFLRKDGSPGIAHTLPTYFFEVSPDWYRYGFGFWPESAAETAYFRAAAGSDYAALEARIDWVNAQADVRFETELYKKDMCPNAPPKARQWLQGKHFTFLRYEAQEGVFFTPALLGEVTGYFDRLYPLYAYFMDIAKGYDRGAQRSGR